MCIVKRIDDAGHEWDSLSEFFVWSTVIRPSGIPALHNQLLRGNDGAIRRPDWAIPCSCARHVIVWEETEMMDDPAYRGRWLDDRLDWYERNANWVFLILTTDLDRPTLQGALAQIRDLRANDCAKLHAWLAAGASARRVQVYRSLLEDWGIRAIGEAG